MKIIEKNKSIELRLQGFSYGKIAKDLKVSKGTVSKWCSNIELTDQQINNLTKNSDINRILVGLRNKEKWNNIRAEMLATYAPPIEDPFFMLGLGLYWGEGAKYNESETSISNSNKDLLLIFISWLNKFFNKDFTKINVKIQHYNPQLDKEVTNYWCKALNIPLENFRKSMFLVSKVSQKKRNTLTNGTVSLICCGEGVWKIRQKIGKALNIVAALV